MTLELLALYFLRFGKRCHVALRERNPRANFGRPDIIGITEKNHILEIEIKRSASDFRVDAKKFQIMHRMSYLEKCSRQFWYLMPFDLARKMEKEIPPWAGLLSGPSPSAALQLHVLKKAPCNAKSPPLCDSEKSRLLTCMANQILSNETLIGRLQGTYTGCYYMQPEYEI